LACVASFRSASLPRRTLSAARSKFARIAKINIANLAGVPSIVYGILGLQIFVHSLHLGKSVLAGGFTLALLVLPIVIVAAGEAVRAVPPSFREGAYALGATRWQVIWHIVFPLAFPGILTGVILAVSRAIGETAPLIAMGALTFVPFTLSEGCSHLPGRSVRPRMAMEVARWIGEKV